MTFENYISNSEQFYTMDYNLQIIIDNNRNRNRNRIRNRNRNRNRERERKRKRERTSRHEWTPRFEVKTGFSNAE